MSPIQLKTRISGKILELRAIERLIASDRFVSLYEEAEISQQEIVKKHIENLDKLAIRYWMDAQINEHTRIGVLRNRARQLGIAYFSTKTRDTLIREINERSLVSR